MAQFLSTSQYVINFFLLLITFLLWWPVQTLASEPTKKDGSPVETFIIDSVEYVVPPPWSGNKVPAPSFSGSTFRQIPIKYTENESRIYILDVALKPLVEMLEAADGQGILIQVASGYRSVSYQKKIFKRMFAEGRSFEDIIRYVAPPGYSEHMLGVAVDFSPSNWRFGSSRQYAWLRKHGEEFGFQETYSKNNSMKIPWESWHWRYLGQQ